MRILVFLLPLLLPVAGSAASTASGGDGGAATGDDSADAGPQATQDGGALTDGDAPNEASIATTSKVVINFDDVASGTELIEQYAAHARFTSDLGVKMWIENLIAIGQSPHNYMSAGGGSDVQHPLHVMFAKPVSGLRFRALSVTSTGTVAHIKVTSGNAAPVSIDLIGQGDSFTPVPIDLSSYSDRWSSSPPSAALS